MKKIFVERTMNFLKIAIKEDKMKDLYIDEIKTGPSPSDIYQGKIEKIVPALKCAFVDIGEEKKAYMYLDKRYVEFKQGDEIPVEIIKIEDGDKGAKVSSTINIPGKYSVLSNYNFNINFSKKINDEDVKKNFKNKLYKPEDVGVTIRTNAEQALIDRVNDEIKKNYLTYKNILRESRVSLNPKLLYSFGGILGKILRNLKEEDKIKIIVDNDIEYDYCKKYERENIEIIKYNGEESLFYFYDLEKEILSLRNKKISLKCGGNIIIDKTEAMYVIDINTAKNINGHNMEKVIYETNLEAAKEIARQIRLRNLNGIILIDFINMNKALYKNKVYSCLKENLKDDICKSKVYPFTELNLIQITREKKTIDILQYIEEECCICKGKGKKLKYNYLKYLIKNEIKKINNKYELKYIYIIINKVFEKYIKEDILHFVKDIECLDKIVYLNYDENIEYFKIEPLIFKNQMENLSPYKVYE